MVFFLEIYDADSRRTLWVITRHEANRWSVCGSGDSDSNRRTVSWAVAGSVDTDLSFLSLLELYGTEIAERRMPARRVVEALDVIEHI